MKKLTILLLILNYNTTLAQWTVLNSGVSDNLNEIFFPAADTGYVVGYNGTVLKTDDGGLNWTSVNPGPVLDFHDLYFLNSKEGWVVGDSGAVCHTSDGGSNWNCTYVDSAEYINLHTVFALDKDVIYIGGQKDVTGGYISGTTNGGLSWSTASIENYIWDINIKKIGMVNDSVGYAATRGMILKTRDSGMNWYITDTASVYAGEMFHIIEDMAFFPGNDTLYVCGWYDSYFGRTYNGGDQWQHNNDYQLYCLDFISAQTGYAGGFCRMLKTNDGGVTFTDARGSDTTLFCDIYSLEFVNENTGYACGYNGKIIKTTNGGTAAISKIDAPKSELIIYPNPTKNRISFSNQINVKLISSSGQIIAEVINVQELDLTAYDSGIYLLWCTDEEGRFVRMTKIVKE